MIKNERLKISFFSRGILGNMKSVVAKTIIVIDIIDIRLIFGCYILKIGCVIWMTYRFC
jgi:hypothetical protein